MLLDTASMYFRAFYGVPDMRRTADGRPTNAVRGLMDFIASLVRTHRPTHLACCWDVDWRPGWRVAALPSYKTHRLADTAEAALPVDPSTDGEILPVARPVVDDEEETPDDLAVQVPMILTVLQAAGIPVLGAAHFEADDVIATLARTLGVATDVVTGDRDLFQLVDDARGIRVLYTARGVAKHDVIDEAQVRRRYGVAPQLYADFALLRGDASDGLPGVAGIGEKTAATLLSAHGDLAGVMAAAADPTSPLKPGVRSKLLAGADYIAAAGDVVRVADAIAHRITLEELRLRPVVDEQAYACATAELGTVAQRLSSALADVTAAQ